MDTKKKPLVNRIRALRHVRKLSQTALAAHIGVTQNYISRWELGRVTPNLAYSAALADFFGVSLDAVYGRPAPLVTSRRDRKGR